MKTSRTDSQPDPYGATTASAQRSLSTLAGQDLAAMCRQLDERGVKYSAVNGAPVLQRNFSTKAPANAGVFEQCLELNRQAVVRTPGSGAKNIA